MQGKIIKGIGGFYYVDIPEHGLYECKAKGSFRNQKLKPLPGDNVTIDVLDEEKKLGNIIEISERINELIRPAVANVDQALIEFAAAQPNPNLNLLDRFLVLMNRQQVNTIICFNKIDIAEDGMLERLEQAYAKCGMPVILISTYTGEGMEQVRKLIHGKTTVFAGPSGVGKSSLLNELMPEANVKTGEISEKIKRGKHTTRHSELMKAEDSTFLIDTPGFSTLYLEKLDKDELRQYYAEFQEYEGKCRFLGCSHTHEPDCCVKQAVEAGEISTIRYKNYIELYEELKNTRSW
ncbi:MAG: ribosome small subunit-dependent GTPase A [Lachnospiraceae bacterium]|nr:ribosome small subunit-dependent GTPase A [Lachnospiraceae bacterium]MBP3506424.1 ribosome small subunit-dependent GTPase A [Lachnospiraceae bacterium]